MNKRAGVMGFLIVMLIGTAVYFIWLDKVLADFSQAAVDNNPGLDGVTAFLLSNINLFFVIILIMAYVIGVWYYGSGGG